MKPTTRTVTDEQLSAFGFPVEVTDKCVGSKVVVVKGDRRSVAVAKAWAAGFVTWGASDPAPRGTWAEEHAPPRPKPCPEVMAWVRSQQGVAA